MSRDVDEALMDRIVAAVADAGVSRAIVEHDWPECHKRNCQARHGDVDVSMGHMKHQIIEAVKRELKYEATTRPDVSVDGDTPEQAAGMTLGVLLHQYRPEVTGTYAKAAQLIVDAYPGVVPALAGVVAEEPEWEYVPGWIANDGRARVSPGLIAPDYVAEFIAEGGEVVRRRVSKFETVTADMVPVKQEGETHE